MPGTTRLAISLEDAKLRRAHASWNACQISLSTISSYNSERPYDTYHCHSSLRWGFCPQEDSNNVQSEASATSLPVARG